VQRAPVQLNNKLKCNTCLKLKTKDEFGKRKDSSTGHKHICKLCERDKQRSRSRHKYEEIYFYLVENPCVRCGESNPLKLEFDHIKDKKVNVSRMCSGGWSVLKMWEEISKCQVLCGSCHAEKTHTERNSTRYQIHEECK